MTTLRVLLARLGGLFWRSRRDRRLQEELQEHLRCLADDHIRAGLTPEDAERAARRDLGAAGVIAEAYRDQRGLPGVHALGQDCRFALRLFGRRPGFTAVAVTALALGIGVSTTFFTLVNAICLRGLPIERPGDVLFLRTERTGGQQAGLSYPEFQDLRRDTTSFEGMAAYTSAPVIIGDEGLAPERVTGTYISAGAFGVLGWQPVLGREFREDEDRPGAHRVAMLSHAVWESRYASDPSIPGRVIDLNGEPATVVGVLPERIRFPANTGVWMPLGTMPDVAAQPRSLRSLSVFGRLTPDDTSARAAAELNALDSRWSQAYPQVRDAVRTVASPINDEFNGNITDTVWLAFITAGVIVLLVACANVANLLLMQAASRSREMTIRASMGATRLRIIRQLLVESALLSIAGAVGGLILAVLAVQLLAASVPTAAPLPFWIEFAIDERVLAALTAACIGCVFVCGLMPAWHASDVRLPTAFRTGGQAGSGRVGIHRRTAWLLAVEVALSLVLLANMAMSVRDVLEARLAEVVVDPSPLLTAELTLPDTTYDTVERRATFYEQLQARVSAIEGVASAALASHAPFRGAESRPVSVDGRPAIPGISAASVQALFVGAEYFETIGVSLVRGRTFVDLDGSPGQPGAIVNERFEALHFPGESAIGQRLRLAAAGTDAEAEPLTPLTIVGVSTDVRQRTSESPEPVVYLPFTAASPHTATLVVRTGSDDPVALAPVMRDAMRSVDPRLPLDRVLPLAQALSESGWNGRVSILLLYTITIIAFLLAMVGLYAVTAHRVTQRIPEIGLRMAVGASAGQIAGLVLRGAMAQLGLGLALGLALILVFTRLFGPASDSLTAPSMFGTFLALVAAVTLVAGAACIIPALRAARVDPATALRCE